MILFAIKTTPLESINLILWILKLLCWESGTVRYTQYKFDPMDFETDVLMPQAKTDLMYKFDPMDFETTIRGFFTTK